MTIAPFRYFIISLIISLSTCICCVLCSFQLYGNYDYVHNYLGHTGSNDSASIPIAGFIIASIFFSFVHVLAHLKFFELIRTGKLDRNFELKFGFYKDERKINWAMRIMFYLLAAYFIYDYALSFYEFYIFEFLFYLFIVLTLIAYCLTITNLIESKRIQIDV